MKIFFEIVVIVVGLFFLLDWIFDRWLNHRCKQQSRPDRVHFEWSVGPVQPKEKVEQTMKVVINNLQKTTLTLAPKNDAQQAALLDGKPTWTKTSGDADIQVADDGMSATLISGNPGDSTFLVEADADLTPNGDGGAGIQNISDVIQLTVEGARAVSLGLTVGTPELK